MWEYTTSDSVYMFAGVDTIDDYLEARNHLRPRQPAWNHHPADRSSNAPAQVADSFDLGRLHPDVLAAAGQLFNDGHYPQSIFEPFKAVEIRVRELSGSRRVRPRSDGIGARRQSAAHSSGS